MKNTEAIETLIANYPDACFEQLREAVDAAIEALKVQDAVEVVRCKDCKWWKLSAYNTVGIHICHRFSGVRGEYDFCSRGEKKENDRD